MKYWKYFIPFCCALVISQAVAFSPDAAACFVKGQSQHVSCTTLDVPRLYQQENSASRQIHIVRVVAKSATTNPPLFVLAGGPGQAASEMTQYINVAFQQILKQHDIIFIDQRGSGKSFGLGCDTHDLLTRDDITAAFDLCRENVLPYMQELTTETYVKDIEQVRQHFGYSQISLWGGSYGTFAAQAYASYFPEQVHTLLLDAVLALTANPLVNGGPYAENALQRLYALCQKDRRCSQRFDNWPAQVLALKSQLNKQPVALNKDTLIDGVELMHLIRAALYSPEISARLPLAIDRASAGDFSMFNAISQATAGAATDSMYLGLTMGVLCQEHVFAGQGALAKELGKNSFVGDSYYRIWADICAQETLMKTAQVQLPTQLSMPTLMISGELDPITPEQSAEQALSYLTNSTHLIMPNAAIPIQAVAACQD